MSMPNPLPLAALAGFFIGTASVVFPQSEPNTNPRASIASQPLAALGNCVAVDGDTLRCGAERVRLIGIDSPEMPGHCRPGRQCVAGDPFAAQAALGQALGRSMTVRRFGTDHYGRTLALVSGPQGDLSCLQLRTGHAIYRADWDEEGAMKQTCG